MNIGMIIGKARAEAAPEAEKGPSRAELLMKAKEAAAGRIIKAIKDEEPSALVYAMESYEELCAASESEEE